MQRRPFTPWLFAAVLACASSAPHAQEWPKGPVRVIVPFGPGSTPDLLARVIAERLGTRLGKPMVVENKAGAAGNIGTDALVKSAPDGQTIGIATPGPLAVNALLFKRLPYDPVRDVEAVAIAATQPAVLVVSAKVPAGTVAELLALLKKGGVQYSFASIGAGSASHLAMETLGARTGADLVHVPYSGSGAAVTAIISGEVDLGVLPAAAVMPHVKAGKIKSLAIASSKRSALLPDLPTLAEAGLPEVQADAWMGVIVPARTRRILAEPGVRERLRVLYMEPVGSTPDEFRRALADESARWKPVIQKHNITLD